MINVHIYAPSFKTWDRKQVASFAQAGTIKTLEKRKGNLVYIEDAQERAQYEKEREEWITNQGARF